MASKQIPVYLFTGFLESGKTKFIQETLEDNSFNNGPRMLLLVCEEGIEEYEPDNFASENIFMETIESEDELSASYLEELRKKHRCSYVIIEYNGMWMLDSLYLNLPDDWVVAQEFLFIDSATFLNYNNNMRQLMVDKIQSCEPAVLNRFPAGDEDLKMQAHKIIRAVNRRCDIAFEAPDGKVTYDDIELPLPYDLNAPVVEIEDDDYAIFLQDIMEEPEKYEGKRVRLKGRAVLESESLKPGYFLFGRQVMTCCIEDIRFIPILAEWKNLSGMTNMGWYTVTARVDIRLMPDIYNGPGPVLHVRSIVSAQRPEQEVAMFY